MKLLKVLVIILCLLATKGFAQSSSSVDVRLSYSSSVLGSVGRNFQMVNSSASQTSLISGFDLKMMFPSKHRNFRWLLGSFYQDGQEYDNSTLVGAAYFGPHISTKFRYLNFETYISAGIFGVSDEILEKNQNTIVYQSSSNYAAPGTKSGLGISFSYKKLSMTGGYQIFMASGKDHTVMYHGIEVGVGVKL